MSTASYSSASGPHDQRTGSSSDTRSSAGAAADTARSDLQAAADQVKARAGKLFDDAKGSAQTQLNEKKDEAADELRNVAGALRDAAQRRPQDDPLLGLTGSAADGLERLSGALRNKDVGVMLRDMESFARRQPVAFFGFALATGFLAVRFLKASSD